MGVKTSGVKNSCSQLDDETLSLLRDRLARHGGNRTALARELDYSRAAVSQALDGRYPGSTDRLRARIIERLAVRVKCPHLKRDLATDECRAYRERPLSAASAGREDVRHWNSCQACRFNPLASHGRSL